MRKCTICQRQDRATIDTLMLGGSTLRDIAGRTGCSKSSLDRHRSACISSSLVRSAQATRDESLQQTWQRIKCELDEVAAQAKANKDMRTLLSALAQLRGMVDTALKAGELANSRVERFDVDGFMSTLGQVIDKALAPWPDARLALAQELDQVESKL